MFFFLTLWYFISQICCSLGLNFFLLSTWYHGALWRRKTRKSKRYAVRRYIVLKAQLKKENHCLHCFHCLHCLHWLHCLHYIYCLHYLNFLHYLHCLHLPNLPSFAPFVLLLRLWSIQTHACLIIFLVLIFLLTFPFKKESESLYLDYNPT